MSRDPTRRRRRRRAPRTAVIGVYGLRVSRTTSDFYVASRTVRPLWNASAISGEYLSAGIVPRPGRPHAPAPGSEAFWFPIGYTAGYLMLLMFVAAPLRRSGAYTVPDFTEARLESVWARVVTSVLVIVIGWFYIVPQLQGLRSPSAWSPLPAWAGSLASRSSSPSSVAAGGMRSITFVQAFQFWLKLTALAVPVVFLLLVVGGRANRVPRPPRRSRPRRAGRPRRLPPGR